MPLKPLTLPIALGLLVLSGCGGGGSGGSASSSDSSSDSSTTPDAVVRPVKLNDTGLTQCASYPFKSETVVSIADAFPVDNLDCAEVGATQTEDGAYYYTGSYYDYNQNGYQDTGEPDRPDHSVPAGQDATYGRDALAAQGLLEKVGDGPAGFDFTKLDADGGELPADASDWDCVRDNVTGLVWEVKKPSGLHNSADTLTWYQDLGEVYGYLGTERWSNTPDTCEGYQDGQPDSYCNTSAFVNRVNQQGLCGYNDWRLPSSEELRSIADYSGDYSDDTTCFSSYFPNNHPLCGDSGGFFYAFWTSQTVVGRDSYRDANDHNHVFYVAPSSVWTVSISHAPYDHPAGSFPPYGFNRIYRDYETPMDPERYIYSNHIVGTIHPLLYGALLVHGDY